MEDLDEHRGKEHCDDRHHEPEERWRLNEVDIFLYLSLEPGQ